MRKFKNISVICYNTFLTYVTQPRTITFHSH
jgi:hypothetical protein